MSPEAQPGPPDAPVGRLPLAGRAAGSVAALDARRIARALRDRTRYRYVQPRVVALPDGQGWTVVSPNCSRSVDPAGGEIPIAWFEPQPGLPARWRVHRHQHAQRRWILAADGLTLEQALALVCTDTLGVWWP